MRYKILFAVLALTLLLVALYSGARLMDSVVMGEGIESAAVSSKTIERNGVEYYPNQKMTVVLLMGIDQEGIAAPSESYNNKGSADAVSLLVFNRERQVCDVLCLNRDTMMDIPVLGIGGKRAGSVYGQLATSHNYGTGMEDSCENTRQAVSDFLYGLQIDYYISLHMDGIPILNDAVGGVNVEVVDDFSEVDPTIQKGTMHLNGEQAYNFIRSRKNVGNQLNDSRMDRQKEYIGGLVDSARNCFNKDESYYVQLFDMLSDYVVTDCSATVLSKLFADFSEYPVGRIIIPEGEYVRGEQYYEFYVDSSELDRLIIELFYKEK